MIKEEGLYDQPDARYGVIRGFCCTVTAQPRVAPQGAPTLSIKCMYLEIFRIVYQQSGYHSASTA